MVDLHCHLLPLVDDGPASVEQSLLLARQATAEGIRHLIATPHLSPPDFHTTPAQVGLIVAEFNVLLQQRDIPLTVYTGHEILFDEDMVLDIDNGGFQTLANSQYVLIDVPDDDSLELSDWIEAMIREGYRPILSNVEQKKTLREQPDRLADWIKAGAFAQVSCAGITGDHGKDVRQFALALLKNGYAQLVASDAHHATRRPFRWKSCQQQLLHELDESRVTDLYHNAECVLLNRPLAIIPLRPLKKNWKGQWA